MTNSMLHWPLVWLSKSLFQHLRTYLIELGQTGPLCHFYIWAYESYLFLQSLLLTPINHFVHTEGGRALHRSYFLIISGQRKKTIMSLLCTRLLKNTSNIFKETIKGNHTIRLLRLHLPLAISLQHHSQVIIQQLCQYGSYHTINSYFSLIIYCVITAYMLNHLQ